MAILESFQAKSPAFTALGPEIICISDDDDDNHSSDEYEFENVFSTNVSGDGEGEANDKEISDDEIKDNRANDNEGASTDLGTSDNVFAPGDASDCEASDEYDIADFPPVDDASGRDVGDRNPTNDEGIADEEPVTDDASTDDEALNFDPNDCTDAPSTLNTTMVAIDTWEGVFTEITTFRDRLTQLEPRSN
ncbi:hypothetical protein ACHAQH_009645 [Verticillium albo-atrum]